MSHIPQLKLVWIWTLMVWFINYINEVSKGVSIGISNKSKMSWKTNKRRVAWIFNVVGAWTQGESSHRWAGAPLIWVSGWSKGGNIQAFLSAWPKCGAQGEKKGGRFKSYQQTQKWCHSLHHISASIFFHDCVSIFLSICCVEPLFLGV